MCQTNAFKSENDVTVHVRWVFTSKEGWKHMADIAPGFPFEMLPTYPVSKCVTIHWTTWNGGMQLSVCVCMSLPVLCLPTLNDPLFSTTPASTFCARFCVLCNLYQLVIQTSLEETPSALHKNTIRWVFCGILISTGLTGKFSTTANLCQASQCLSQKPTSWQLGQKEVI